MDITHPGSHTDFIFSTPASTGTSTIVVYPPRNASLSATNISASGIIPPVTRADFEPPVYRRPAPIFPSSPGPFPDSAFDTHSSFTINHLEVELSSTTRELESLKTILRNERQGWARRAYLYDKELVGLRGEVAYFGHVIATAGIDVGSCNRVVI